MVELAPAVYKVSDCRLLGCGECCVFVDGEGEQIFASALTALGIYALPY